MWLLDTVAVSEWIKPRMNTGYLRWLSGISEAEVHTSVLCLGETRRGVVSLTEGEKRDTLEAWLKVDLPRRFGPRILAVDERVAARWGALGVRGKAEPIDALIGCTAAVHGLTIVTRNARHFQGLGAAVLNPWS